MTELATHGTVADQITQDVGVPVVTAVRWARQACAGVARIHDHNLLRCDIKPENLFLDERGDVLVGDLGLAQLMDQNGMVHAAGSIPTTLRLAALSIIFIASATTAVQSDGRKEPKTTLAGRVGVFDLACLHVEALTNLNNNACLLGVPGASRRSWTSRDRTRVPAGHHWRILLDQSGQEQRQERAVFVGDLAKIISY